MKLIDKGRILETRIKVKHETKKQLKRHRYQIFLHEHPYLPGKKKLKRWRRNFILGGMICMLIPVSQTLFFYRTIWDQPDPLMFEDQEPSMEQLWKSFLNVIPAIFGAIFLIMLTFGLAIDWVIYRRWGNSFTIMKW